MKIFLLIYDRRLHRITRLTEYAGSERDQALRDRYRAEIAGMKAKRDEEIVILEAPSLEAIKRTHGAYFQSVRELGQRLLDAAS